MKQQPNILFLLSDEHSFRFLEHRSRREGGEPVLTPHLSRLAKHATEYTDAYCAMPLCTPSRMCLLAGREVRHCGAWTNDSVLRPEIPTLPGTLAQAGYATCLVGKMHLGGNLQFAGFQHRPYGDLTGKTGHQWEPLAGGEKDEMRWRTAKAGLTEIPEGMLQEQVVATESVAWVREHVAAHPKQPWFLCASFSRPHFPLTAPRRHFEYYRRRGVPPPFVTATGDAYPHPMSVAMRAGFRSEDISPDECQRARAAYFACVTYLDEVIGDLLRRMEGLLENTIIVYTSDHGELAGEHGVWWKNGWQEASVRVPLLVALPKQRRRVCRTPVSLLDLFPTLCLSAGFKPPAGLDGVELGRARPVVCDALTPRWGPGTEFRMVRQGRYKHVRFRNAPPLCFDVEKDPGEQHNLGRQVEDGMDFEAAHRERTVRDAGLRAQYRLDAPGSTGNLYLTPHGKLINADDPLYRPTVISDHPSTLFPDWPK